MRANGISNLTLCEAVARAEAELVAAHLGKFLIKQRIARAGQGKSAGFRVVLFYRQGNRAVFLHLFAKNDKGNLAPAELDALRDLAKELAALGDDKVAALLNEKWWIEIDYEGYQDKVSQQRPAIRAPGGGRPARHRRDR